MWVTSQSGARTPPLRARPRPPSPVLGADRTPVPGGGSYPFPRPWGPASSLLHLLLSHDLRPTSLTPLLGRGRSNPLPCTTPDPLTSVPQLPDLTVSPGSGVPYVSLPRPGGPDPSRRVRVSGSRPTRRTWNSRGLLSNSKGYTDSCCRGIAGFSSPSSASTDSAYSSTGRSTRCRTRCRPSAGTSWNTSKSIHRRKHTSLPIRTSRTVLSHLRPRLRLSDFLIATQTPSPSCRVEVFPLELPSLRVFPALPYP